MLFVHNEEIAEEKYNFIYQSVYQTKSKMFLDLLDEKGIKTYPDAISLLRNRARSEDVIGIVEQKYEKEKIDIAHYFDFISGLSVERLGWNLSQPQIFLPLPLN